MQSPAAHVPVVLPQRVDDREADRPEEHADHQDRQQDVVVGERLEPAHVGREAGVRERHRRVEGRLPEGFERVDPREDERRVEQHGDDRLDHQRREGDRAQQHADLAEADGLTLVDRAAVRAQRVGVARRDELRAQPEALGDHQAQDRGERQHAHSADVDADEDDGLAERRERAWRCRPCVSPVTQIVDTAVKSASANGSRPSAVVAAGSDSSAVKSEDQRHEHQRPRTVRAKTSCGTGRSRTRGAARCATRTAIGPRRTTTCSAGHEHRRRACRPTCTSSLLRPCAGTSIMVLRRARG